MAVKGKKKKKKRSRPALATRNFKFGLWRTDLPTTVRQEVNAEPFTGRRAEPIGTPTIVDQDGHIVGEVGTLELMNQQFRLAHRYRNKLARIEIARRNALKAHIKATYPIPAAIQVDIDVLEAQKEAIYIEHRKRRQKARQQLKMSATDVAEVERLKGALKPLYKKLSVAMKPIWDNKEPDPRIKYNKSGAPRKARAGSKPKTMAKDLVMREINDKHLRIKQKAQHRCGLKWGSYLLVERFCESFTEGPPPRFRPYDGSGSIAVQLGKGTTIADVEDGHAQAALYDPPNGPQSRGGEHGGRVRKHKILRFRIGGHRTHLKYIEIPVVLHRDIPRTAKVQWIVLRRYRIADKFVYTVRFELVMDNWMKDDLATDGRVGFDVCWRKMQEGFRCGEWRPAGLRVGYWVGSDGQHDEVLIPQDKYDQWLKCDDLQSIRKKAQNALRDEIGKWRNESYVPDWFRLDTLQSYQWESPKQFHRLMKYWSRHRFAGDEGWFRDVEAWQAREKHLYDWQANLNDQLIAWRLDFYRNVAAYLSRRYATLYYESLEINKFCRYLPPESEDNRQAYMRQRNIASPGYLRNTLLARFRDSVEQPPEFTTLACHVCGHVDKDWDPATELIHRCMNCGDSWDQDYNAAENLLNGKPQGLQFS